MTRDPAVLWIASPLWTDITSVRNAIGTLDTCASTRPALVARWVTIGSSLTADHVAAWAKDHTIPMIEYPFASLPPGPIMLALAFVRNDSAPEMSVIRALRRDRVHIILASATIPDYAEIVWHFSAERRPV